jgi:N-acetylmuramoyl-L-alanine amidase
MLIAIVTMGGRAVAQTSATSTTIGGLTAPVSVAPVPAPLPAGPASKIAPVAKPAVSDPASIVPAAVKVTGVKFSGDQSRTQMVFDLTGPIKPNVFVLGEPTRLIVDVPDLQFKFTAADVPKAHGLITAWRYGLFAARKSRIVLDAGSLIKVDRSQVVAKPGGQTWQLLLDVSVTDPATFGATLKAQPRSGQPALKAGTFDDLPAASGKLNSKPVIVIDPGHGGLDPGAVIEGVYEKNVVLAVARNVRASLIATGRYDVAMTRSGDVFVSLDQRLKTSGKLRADLFISIHADSVGQVNLAQNIRGATVYTLSEQASDEQARLLAEKENAADLLAGLERGAGQEQDQVRNILVDLLKRETSNFSHDFRGTLVSELRRHVAMARDPQRSAAFKVLKQTQTPSVLIELGYMSNVQDQKLLQSAEWQKQVGASIATAVDAFFAKRPATAAK